jgi:rhodanese-related sulfurtransferase/ABC-type phosphate/phosphonate transport system substrate-binding protein
MLQPIDWAGRLVRLAGIALLVAAGAAGAQGTAPSDRWLVSTGEQGDSDKLTLYAAWNRLIQELAGQAKLRASPHFSRDATNDLFTTRGGTVAVIAGPGHIIGSALRYGHYVPVAASDHSQQVVLVTLKSTGVRSFTEARGKALGLASQDAIATYLMRGEANAAGTSLKQHFSRVYYTQEEEALLNALKFGTTDLVAVDERLFERWRAAGEPVVAVMKTKEAPGVGVVAHKSLGKTAIRAMQDALLAGMTVPGRGGDRFRSIDNSAYEYVATLGYFTPRTLAGTELVTAQQAQQLVTRGVPLFDGRTEEEFRTGRPAGARWLPYVERSTKETDYDDAKDELDLSKLPADKSAELMFSCGGPECWKSYKSARKAMKAGYTKIYWFRGGIHEWRQAGLPIEKG